MNLSLCHCYCRSTRATWDTVELPPREKRRIQVTGLVSAAKRAGCVALRPIGLFEYLMESVVPHLVEARQAGRRVVGPVGRYDVVQELKLGTEASRVSEDPVMK